MPESRYVVEYDNTKIVKRIHMPEHVQYLDQITSGFWVDGNGEYTMGTHDTLYFIMPHNIRYIENTNYVSP